MNILITGGAGFIGSHTADALIRAGHHVRIMDYLDPQIHGKNANFPAYLNPKVECLKLDVRVPENVERALDGIEAVYHFAACTGVGQSMYDLGSYVSTNCTGTAVLLEALIKRKQPLKRLVLASSRAVYGEGTHSCPLHGTQHPGPRRREDLLLGRFDVFCPECGASMEAIRTPEDRPLFPGSVYAWTKKQQEEQCVFTATTFGLPVTILRYFNVYGSRQSLKNPYTGVVSIFFSRLMSGAPISLYEHGLPVRDFVHVLDIARANVAALQADVPSGSCINIGSGVAHTIKDIVMALSKASGRSTQLEDRGEYRVGDVGACYADLTRARTLLGYVPSISLEQGMSEFFGWAHIQEYQDLYARTVTELQSHGLFGCVQKETA